MIDDPYSDCEMALVKIIASLTDIFKAEAVTQGDYIVLEKGFDRCCVLTPSDFLTREINNRKTNTKVWGVSVDIFQRYEGAITTTAKFRMMRSNVIRVIETHPSLYLNQGVQVAGVTGTIVSSANKPTFIEREGTNVTTHLTQELYVQVAQLIEYNSGELND